MAEDVLGRMVIELGLDHSDFGRGLQGAQREAKYAMAEMKSSLSVVAASGREVDTLRVKQAGLTKAIEAQARVVAEQKRQYEGSRTATGAATGATAKYATQLQNANAKLNSLQNQLQATARAYAEIQTRTEGFTGGLNRIGTAATSAGAKMSSVGKTMTMGVTVPLAAGFVAATNKAMEFDNKMLETKNLIQTGGESAQEAISGVSTMSKDAITLSNHYGVSVNKIADGYQDLVKRGYTSSQAIGAMKTELQGALASGDDFSDVVTVASQTLEAFDMRAKTTSGMTRNTKTVVNELAYAADLTATNFSDLGLGMSYVGSTAHQAGFSLSETASAMGILSNNGLEADKAGTGLRKAINSLVSPTKNGKEALETMGLTMADFVDNEGKLKSMTDIFGILKDHVKGFSKTDQLDLFHDIFGTTGQQAAIILSNNAKALGDLNKQVAQSSKKDYVGQLSEKNLASAQNQLKIFKESFSNLGMSLARDVLPEVTPLLRGASQLVQKFGDLDEGTKRLITNSVLAAAAAGPVLLGVGKLTSGFGRTATGVVDLVAKFRGMRAAKTALDDTSLASKALTSAIGGTTGITEKAAGGFSLFGKALTTGGESAGILGTALTPVGATVLGVTAAVGAGVAVWELWGKGVYESSERTKRWGSDIGSDADQAASKFSSFETKASAALDNTAEGASQNAKKISEAFDDMAKSAEDSVQKQHDAAEKIAKDVGGDAGAAIEKQANKEKSANDKRISNMKDYAQQVASITKQSRDNNVKLTNEQRTVIGNLQTKMAEEQVKTLGLTAKQQRLVLAAELNQTSKMSQDQLAEMAKASGEAAYKEQSTYVDRIAKIKNNDKLTTKERNAGLEALEREHSATMTKIGEGYINAAKAQGKSRFEIEAELTEQYGYTAAQAKKAFDEYNSAAKRTQGMAAQITSTMSSDTRKAGEAWNNLVLDPKTGKVKTNLSEVLKDAAGVKGGWKALDFELKHAKISTNAKQMIAETMSMSNEWKSLPDMEKTAIVRAEGKKDIAGIMDQFVEWNSLSLKDQQAVVKGNYQPLVDALIKNKQWNQMSLKQQEAVVKDKATLPLVNALVKTEEWNKLKPAQKEAILKAKGQADLADLVAKYGLWDKLPEKEKKLLISDKDARQKLLEAGVNIGQYNATPIPAKELRANHADLMSKLSQAKLSVSQLSQAPAIKKIIGNNQDLIQKLNSSDSAMRQFNSLPTPVKKLIADAYGFNLGIDQATGKLVAYNALDPHTKNPGVNITPVVNAFGTGINSILQYNGQNPNEKHTTASDVSLGSTLSSGTSQIGAYNSVMPATKLLNGNATGVLNATSTASSSLYNYMGIAPAAKGLNANDNATGPANSAISALARFRDMGDITRTITTVNKMINSVGKAKGTNDFEGGLATVNDQPGPVFRELIKEPGKAPYIPIGRNVTIPLLKHAKVVPATTTARMFRNLPQFADGLNVPANVAPVRMARELTSEIDSPDGSGDSGALQMIIGLLTTIAKQNPADLITAMLGKIELSTDVTLDKRSMAKFVSQVANQDIAKAISRAKGGKAI